MEQRASSVNSDDAHRSKGAPRTSRACLQCRQRKQRCLPSPIINGVQVGPQAPCKRCRHHSITCSFETDPIPGPDVERSPSKMAQIVVDLERRLNLHEARIEELEKNSENQQSPQITEPVFEHAAVSKNHPPENHNGSLQNQTQPHGTFTNALPSNQDFNMDGVDLGPPIATLRSFGALSEGGSPNSSRTLKDLDSCDPVTRGILSARDAKIAVNIYFDHCHPMAPFLSEKLRFEDNLRSSPILFLAICSVGARLWNNEGSSGLHPNFFQLTTLLESTVSRLILQPKPSEITLDSIRAIMIFLQWMPYVGKLPKSRYSDISAWSILGVAIRFADFLGLDKSAILPFQGSNITDDDITRLRLWRNLLTCDCLLMLSSGLPSTLDPTSAVEIGEVMISYSSQLPEDLRITALVELVVIVYRVSKTFGDHSGRNFDSFCLKKVNSDFDEWERSWVARLGNTESQHVQLPFNSVRWYRLALNSAPLGPFLSKSETPMQIWLLQSLETCLTAASQTLFSLSTYGTEYVWMLSSQNVDSFPDGTFSVDIKAIESLYYAVDSTWICHAFSVVFLVLCYVRGTIDDDLRIRNITPEMLLRNCSPLPPRSNSIISRLIHLALEIFDGVCHGISFHPAKDFKSIVNNASILLNGVEEVVMDEAAIQSLLDSINDSGMEWPMDFVGAL